MTVMVAYGVERPVRDRNSPSNVAKDTMPSSTAAVNTPKQPEEEKDYRESLARSKAARQPQIRDKIIESLRAKLSKSYEKITADIDYWGAS
jgi:hypothetical protein